MLSYSTIRTAILSWLVLVSVVLFGDRGLFRTPVYEQADDAANALSIDSAKHGAEIYGNYSRFYFRHPGPAFAYVYAAGEAILEDGLGLVASRHNAHLLTGILLQAAFLALAIGIAASHTGNPSRSTLLLTGVALVHFAFVPGSFVQIWPPLVLIMPFALFTVAAASVASGRTEDSLWLALGAAFLLHGHIAQLMFVGAVLVLVLGILAYRRLKGESIQLPATGRCVGVLIVAALTALPWVIDASRGRDSNIFDVWLHIKRSANDPLRPNWTTSVADTASYFCYCVRQNDWFSPGATRNSWQFLRSCGLGAFAAFSGFSACGLSLWRGRASRTPSAVFQRCLAGICSVSIFLCVIWARRQDGGITFFNSLFIFGLMMAIWVIPILTLAEEASGRTIGAVVVILAGALAANVGRYGELPYYMEIDALGREAAAKVARALSKETHPEKPKLLIFSHDDWDKAVTVAAALNRMGIRSYVPQSDYGIWRIMFGGDHVLDSVDQVKALGPFSWWRPARGSKDGARLVDDLRDEFPNRERSTFPFAFDLQHPEESFGLSVPEDHGTWTESKVVFFRLWSELARSDVRMTFRASAVPLERGEFQRVRILVNGTALPEILVTGLSDFSVTVPRTAWNGGTPPGLVELAWGLPDSARLAAQPHPTESDSRLLGLCLHRLRFELIAPGR